jgi:fucose 4-O-acetylase-like acetyltransferase
LLGLAAATPPSRDRYADFLRAFSILVVVFGHWLIAVVTWEGGKVDGQNALELIDGIWILTWLLQVMPLFFFVGGFSNLRSWEGAERRGEGYAVFLYTRMLRMMRPTIVFLGLTLTIITILDKFNVADNVVFPASELIARPLWFLGVYMIVVALAPAMIGLHRRYGAAVVVAMAAIAVAVDVLRFGFDLSGFGYVNYPVVWLMAHQLGFLYADGTLARVGKWLAGGAIVVLLALVNLGPYPGSMVGLSRDEFSNMDPPTVAIGTLILWQVGLAMVLRVPVTRWLQRLRVWAAVIYVNSVIMTVFLWHLTAMLFGIGILFPLGFPQPDAGTGLWWGLRPVWIAVLLVLLALFVLGFGRFESRGMRRLSPSAPSAGLATATAAGAALGAVFVLFGVLGFAMGGMHQLFSVTGTELIVFNLNPMLNVIHLAVGWILLRGSVRGPQVQVVMSAGACVILVMLAGYGWAAAAGTTANRFAVNEADTVLHLAAVAVTGVVAYVTARRSTPPEPGRS